VRVVAGRHRGRHLKAPPGDATRPTGARVKEALFSILGHVEGERVLDAYAGSGALGIEALSRGAAFTVFVEAARPALACLRENLTALGLMSESLVLPLRMESASVKLKPHAPFDLVLCDPPWRDVAAARGVLESLATAGLFSPRVRIVLEHGARDPPPLLGAESLLMVVDERRWGDTAISLLGLKSGPANAPGSGDP
jgi:16S rRNA (guanine966-N2)-methyltransferase